MSNLRKAREKKGLRLNEAAKKLGMTAATLRALEDGAFPPSATERAALALLYGAHLIDPRQGHLFGDGPDAA